MAGDIDRGLRSPTDTAASHGREEPVGEPPEVPERLGHVPAPLTPDAVDGGEDLRDRRGGVDRAAVGTPIVRTPRFPTLQQVEEAGDFEGVVSFGVGLRRRTGFRAFHLSSPGRIVLDVAH